jgi:hypothetical protein
MNNSVLQGIQGISGKARFRNLGIAFIFRQTI